MLYTERLYWMKNLTCDIFMCVTQPLITSILRFLDNHAYITTMGGKEKVLFFDFAVCCIFITSKVLLCV